MTKEHDTIQALAAIVTIWGTIFFGVWALPLDNQTKISIDIVCSVSVGILALIYFMHKGSIPIPDKEKLDKVSFWLRLLQLFLISGLSLYIGCITWEVVIIQGIAVVTYTNLISLYYGILGVITLVLTFWVILNRNPYRKNKQKKRGK